MSTKTQLLVVTDLDASLLDESYSWAAAKPSLAMLKALGIPLVLNSSKTVAEMKNLADELGTKAPIIAENGGILAIPLGMDQGRSPERSGDYGIQVNGLSRDFILGTAHNLRRERDYQFSGFADWTVEEVAHLTGLPWQKASRSKSRFATEPILWKDTDERRKEFEAALAEEGIRVLRGGRFLHLMGQADKADGLKAARALYEKQQADVRWIVVALGDSANDLAMLEAADIAVVIPHADGAHISPESPEVIHASLPADKGWNEALLSILDKYT